MKELFRLIKSWYKVLIVVLYFFETILLFTGLITSIYWQISILIIFIGLLLFLKYKVEPDLKN